MNGSVTWNIFSDGPGAVTARKLVVYIAIPLISFILHFHVFSRDLVGYHAWRQTQTQINIDNFHAEDSNILHPRINDRGEGAGIHRMDFPLMQWGFSMVYRLAGPGVTLTRILSFFLGIATLYGFYHLLLNVFRAARLAVLGAWAFCFSPLWYYYSVNPMPDNLALCCSVWGMAFCFRYLRSQSFTDAFLSALALGLATLVKLPFVVCVAGVGGYVIAEAVRSGFRYRKGYFRIAILQAVFLLPALAWYSSVVPEWQGNGVVGGILANRLPLGELLNIARFNLVSSLPELLINYGSVIFFMTGVVCIFRGKLYAHSRFIVPACWGAALLLYFVFEMNMIGYVHDYYLLPFLPPVFLIVFYGIRHLVSSRHRPLRITAMACLILLPVTAFLRIDHRWNLESPGFNRDLLAHKTELRNAVPDDALCVVGNDESRNIYFYYIGKKGWGFDHDNLEPGRLKEMILRGARYLYSDSRAIDESAAFKPFLNGLVLESGTIRVYRLNAPSTDLP